MQIEREHLIKCPHCGAEYLPAEIFVSDLLGEPTNILKDEKGHIDYYSGTDMSFEEEYECDYCNHRFRVIGKVNFVVEPIEIFMEEYESTIFEDRIELSEDK